MINEKVVKTAVRSVLYALCILYVITPTLSGLGMVVAYHVFRMLGLS